MEQQKKVTTIPATKKRFTSAPLAGTRKRKVAGYARVSTDHDEQFSSYEAQVDYYTNYIKSRKDWEFVKVYTDEGISGTRISRREGFQHMIDDALAGKIDLIVTKSVSRFARNTVDSLTTIRELKEHGVECFFEKENIWTFDGKGELLITIMSSLAQEESRSISENVTWGHRKRFADGKVSFAYSRVLGLEKDKETGKIVVNKEQAKTVKLIFRLFLEGLNPHAIAAELTRRGIKTPGGKDVWYQGTVSRMLSNEKYKGDALLQKEFTVDFLQHKVKKNEGEVPQYYVKGNHEAIIEPRVFDLVQEELERRHRTGHYSGISIFSSKIKCADCGSWYGPKIWHSNDRYRKVVYRCNNKYKGSEKCQTAHVTEEEVREGFIKAYNRLVSEKKEIIANAKLVRKTLCDTSGLLEKKQKLEEELQVVSDMVEHLVEDNARTAGDQDDYQNRYDSLVERYENARKQFDEVNRQISEKNARSERIADFIGKLKEQDGVIEEFDPWLWACMVDFVTVGRRKEMVFTFRDGTEIEV